MTHWFAVWFAMKHLLCMEMFFDAQCKLLPMNQQWVNRSFRVVIIGCECIVVSVRTSFTHIVGYV